MAAPEKRTEVYTNAECEPELVRESLEKVLTSRSFGHADALARLLAYLVEEKLGGHSEWLKEYTLGVEVFRRGAEFDPRVDTIVRTQVRRLRAKLEDYYSDEGSRDRVIFDIPKGTYVPLIVRRLEQFPLAAQCEPEGKTAGAACALLRVRDSIQRPPRIGRIAGLVALASLIAAPMIQRPVRSSLASERPAIAVLPFADLSNSAHTNLGEGIAEEISQALSRIASLRVAARTSTLQYKGTGADVRKIGSSLGATAVIEGSVRSLGDRIRITAHLVSTNDGYRLWTQNWNTSQSELDRVPDEAARGIALALQMPLAAAGERKHDPEAYRLYLKGRFGPSTNESIAWLDKALAIDPRFASAWMAKAEIYMTQTLRALAAPVDVLPKAREAALRSIRFGSETAAAHVVLGATAAIYEWDWDSAEKEYQRALQMEPRNGFARLHYAHLLAYRGRTAEALEQIERIGATDPKATALPAGQAALFFLARQYDRVLDYCNAVTAVTPSAPDCQYWLGRALLSKGKIAEAVSALEKRRSGIGMGFGFPISAYLASGRRSEALRLRADIERLRQHAYVSPVSLGHVHFAFGEAEEGFRQLERALEVRDQSLPSLKIEPAYDSIRGDPRFQKILRRLRL
jgi:serine/threonine-protein kinase